MGRPRCASTSKYPIVRMESRCTGFKGQTNRKTKQRRFATTGTVNAFHALRKRAIKGKARRARRAEIDENLEAMMSDSRARRAAAAAAARTVSPPRVRRSGRQGAGGGVRRLGFG